MEGLTTDLLIEVAYAVGIGLFVGLEREHTGTVEESLDPRTAHEGEHGEEAGRAPTVFGVRTFALISVLGWACAVGGELWPWLPPIVLVAVAALVAVQYYVVHEQGLGLTTEIAALILFVLGMMVRENRALAVTLSLVVTLLLLSKPFVRTTVRKLRRVELTATLQLLILLAIVLPMLPEEPMDPWGVLPPRKIGLFVILIGGIGYVGYVLTRVLGRRRSAGLTGLVGGLTSSTAVTAAMSQAGRAETAMIVPGQLAVFLANAVMFARVLVVTGVLSMPVARSLAPPLVGMGLVMLVGAWWKWRSLAGLELADREPTKLTNPFALVPALKWGAVLCGVLLMAHFARLYLGDSGLLVAAGASGLADVDAITLAVTGQAAGGELGVGFASLAIAIAVISNTVVKAGLAYVAGGRAFGADVLKIFALSMAVGCVIAVRVLL